MRDTRSVPLFALLLVATGCGTERSEAVKFCQVLNQQQAIVAKANADEVPLMAAIGRWAGQIAFIGGEGVKRDVSTARDFAQQIDNTRAQLASTRQVLEAEVLDHAFNQTVRSGLVTSLKIREKFLLEVKVLLEQSAEGFPHMSFFSHPSSINELISKLQAYSPPKDLIADAIKEVRTKFDIVDSELIKSK